MTNKRNNNRNNTNNNNNKNSTTKNNNNKNKESNSAVNKVDKNNSNNISNINNTSENSIDSDKKIGVLFVCFGNVCRSPMAEAVFAHEVVKHQLNERFIIDSCATGGYHVGREPEGRARIVCKNNKVPLKHKSRRICDEDYTKFDYILCMDNKNLVDLHKLAPSNSTAKIQLFGEYDPEKETIINDPFFSKGIGEFCHCFNQVTRCSLGLLKYLGFLN